MQFVADRFVTRRDGTTVDLATGLRVFLRVMPGDAATEVSWTARCDAWFMLQHPAVAPLVDYGHAGRGERFEAWQCGPEWGGTRAAADVARRAVTSFLRATGLASAGETFELRVRHGAPTVVPALLAAEEIVASSLAGESEIAALPIECRGLAVVDRAPLAALAEMFRGFDGPRCHAAAIWGPPGSGKTLQARQLARLARINGFIPVAAPLVASPYREFWSGRSLFVIDDGGGDGWPAIVDAAIASPVPHALLITSEVEVPGIDGSALAPLAVDQLVAAIRPCPATPPLLRELRRAAERAGGWPGRFAHLLWGADAAIAPAAVSGAARVAEQPRVYGGDESLAVPVSVRPSGTWPAPGELPSLRRRIADADRQLARGRHAAAIRSLRQALAAFARRDAWIDAADAGIRLTRALLWRGQLREVEAMLGHARDYASRAGSTAMLLEVAMLASAMWIERALPEQAESLLTTALTSATVLDHRENCALLALTLGQCLFWRGRYDEAFAALDRVSDGISRRVRVDRDRWRATIAAARGDISAALRIVIELMAVTDTGEAAERAAVLHTAALVYLVAGDLPAASDRASAAIRAAHQAHDSLHAIGARIVLVETERRRGAVSASAQLQRLIRASASLTPLLQAQLAPRDHVKTLPGLAVLIQPDTPRDTATGLPIVDQVIQIVQACQVAEEEPVVLRDVCAHVRQQLYATAVAFFVGPGDRLVVLAADGARADAEVASRAVDAAIVIAPHRHDDRVVAAAPIQYGGTTIGAVSARWALGSTSDQSQAAAVLAATAVVAAPIVSAAIARRDRVSATIGHTLIGTTTAMEQVRRLIERAASAPFPVLIDGESGSGKELVAQAIHRGSVRRDRAFRTLNCAAIPDELAEAELFGHVRGSFTGAIGDRAGVFEEAHGGTLFLDEVGELTPRAQAKLLRVLQEGEIRRVGENLTRRVDVRVVAATNRDLRAECEAGRFRLDLLYRLDVIRISMPPLRDRAEDVPQLVDHFWREATARINSRASLSATTVAALARHHWPGNVRELQNVLAALAVRCPKRGVVPPSALPPSFSAPHGSPAWRLEEARRMFEERFVRAALARTGGHRARAAAELGVSRQGLTKLMSRLGIS